MKKRLNATIVATALTIGMSSGMSTAYAQAGDHVPLPQYTDWQSCTSANPGQNHWTSFGDGPEACYGPAQATPSTPEQPAPSDEPAGPTKEPRPGLWQKPANTTEDGKHCLPGYKRDMGIFDINGQAGECVKADAPAPEPEKPSEPEKPKPSDSDKPDIPGTILPGASEAECKAKGGKILMHVKDPKTRLYGACVITEKPKPSEPEKPKPSDEKKPSKPSKPSDDKKKDDKKSDSKKDDKKKEDDKKVAAKPSEAKKPTKTSESKKSATKAADSKKSTQSSQKPVAQQQKSNGSLAKTGVSVGGLLVAALAMVGAGVFLIRRRQNS